MHPFIDLIQQRIAQLRPKLMDTSRRNPLINNTLSRNTASFIRIVDEKPQCVWDKIIGEGESMVLGALPPLETDPPDEENREFRDAYELAYETDENFLLKINEIDRDNDDSAYEKQAKLERELKDRVREMLGYAQRVESGDPTTLHEHARLHGINPSFHLPEETAKEEDNRYIDNELQTLLLPKPLTAKLGKIESKNNTFAEERGIESLYLALGYVVWSDPASNDKSQSFRSPLLLLPVDISKKKVKSTFRFSIALRDDAIINPVLRHKLLSELDIELYEDDFSDKDFDVEKYFLKVQKRLPTHINARVVRQAVLGVFPFQGIELYNDLSPDNVSFSDFELLCRLFSGTDSSGNEPSLTNLSLDDVESDIATTLVPSIVMDADSSQFLAMMKVASGESIAIEGPPGSGKSQTIVNLIANALENKKSVLFVAQKSTALDVVLSRLTKLGLEKLVLPLTNKSSKSVDFYESLANRVTARPNANAEHKTRELTENILEKKRDIKSYIDTIKSKVGGTSLIVHQLLGLYIKYQDKLSALPSKYKAFELDHTKMGLVVDPSFVEKLVPRVEGWVNQYEVVTSEPDTIWHKVDDLKCDYLELRSIEEKTNHLNRALKELSNEFEFINLDRLSEYVFQSNNTELKEVHQSLLALEELGFDWLSVINGVGSILDLCNELVEINRIQSELASRFNVQWEVLEEFRNHEASLKKILRACEELKIDSIKVENFDRLVMQSLELSNRLNKVCNLHALLSKQFGSDITLKEAIVLEKNAQQVSLFNSPSLVRHLSKEGIEETESRINKLIQLRKKAENIPADLEKIPTKKRLMEISTILMTDGFFGLFNSEVRRARKEAAEILQLPKYVKAVCVSRIELLMDVYRSWEDEELSDAFGSIDGIAPPAILTQAKDEIDQFAQDVRRKGLDPDNLIKKASPELITVLTEHSGAISEVNLDESWDEFLNELKSQSDYRNKIQSLIEENKQLLELISRYGLEGISHVEELDDRMSNIESLVSGWKKSYSHLVDYVPLLGDEASHMEDRDKYISELIHYIKNSTTFLVAANNEGAFNSIGSIQGISTKLRETSTKLSDFKIDLDAYFSLCAKCISSDAMPSKFSSLKLILEKSIMDPQGLNKVMQRGELKEEIRIHGLLPAFEMLCNDFEYEQVPQLLPMVVLQHLVNKTFEEHGEKITKASGTRVDAARSLFQKFDRELILHSANKILSSSFVPLSDIPRGVGYGKKTQYTDLSLIEHQLNLKRKIPPYRLIKRSREALQKLHPCWMMVPTSVASLLPRREMFDLVIIDEASQMTPEQSISALMRAKQAVIVGDTNQLPPTNFFKAVSDAENEDEDIATIEESILELANVQFTPKHRLAWHYRSRHESLIAFSNHYVYDDDLIIFPSPSDERGKMGVNLVRVDGTYTTGLNPNEAVAVTEAAIEFMREHPDKSLGVVTMNQSQQEQIESMILRESEADNSVSDYIQHWSSHERGIEKFFVKNIENVQGDERDVIFISTIYGKDSLGKFRQQFGPINGTAGKRRLNVLFTRAKERITTFTSIPMDLLNPSEHNEGATLLKRWLQYSATGVLGEKVGPADSSHLGPDSPFEEAVIEQVKSLGYIPVPQVGVANYFIDIGIKHPEYPLGYICGIECDGASYHSSKSARDRDILRQEVLERLGWDLVRIWSTDWFRDRYGQLQRIKEYLDQKLEEKKRLIPDVEQVSPETLFSSWSDEEEIQDEPVQEEVISDTKEVTLGTKFRVTYLSGPRSGIKSKFVLVRDANVSSSDEFSPIRSNSPLGQAVMDAREGDVVEFEISDGEIKVRVDKIYIEEEH